MAGTDRYTLIRPDQHVAWRANAWPERATTLLRKVTGRGTRRVQDRKRAAALSE
jgi:hypothetical protein